MMIVITNLSLAIPIGEDLLQRVGVMNEVILKDMMNEGDQNAPIVFRGTLRQCFNYCKQQKDYILKYSQAFVYGCWYYNEVESKALIIR